MRTIKEATMKVGIFFDGKNFYSGWKDRTDQRRIDFNKLTEWLVAQVAKGEKGDLWSAYYYTSIDPVTSGQQTEGQRKLAAFLDERENDAGFVVKRFPKKEFTTKCDGCGKIHQVLQEKEVDTTMVADILRYAANGAFDTCILISGDADHVPAVEGVREMGKKVYVATWANYGLSPRIRKAAFHVIDLAQGLDYFGAGGNASLTKANQPQYMASQQIQPVPVAASNLNWEELVIRELAIAQDKFKPNGYVGLHFFVAKWKSPKMPDNPDMRRRTIDTLKDQGRVIVYEVEGAKAIRLPDNNDEKGSDQLEQIQPTDDQANSQEETAPNQEATSDISNQEQAALTS